MDLAALSLSEILFTYTQASYDSFLFFVDAYELDLDFCQTDQENSVRI